MLAAKSAPKGSGSKAEWTNGVEGILLEEMCGNKEFWQSPWSQKKESHDGVNKNDDHHEWWTNVQ